MEKKETIIIVHQVLRYDYFEVIIMYIMTIDLIQNHSIGKLGGWGRGNIGGVGLREIKLVFIFYSWELIDNM